MKTKRARDTRNACEFHLLRGKDKQALTQVVLTLESRVFVL